VRAAISCVRVVSTTSAERLLGRIQTKVDGLCTERDRPSPGTNKVINRSSGASTFGAGGFGLPPAAGSAPS
jgi:hypothetical protein